MIKFPCKDCSEREANCHSICPKYLSAKEAQDKINKERQLQKEASRYTYEITHRKKKIYNPKSTVKICWENKRGA